MTTPKIPMSELWYETNKELYQQQVMDLRQSIRDYIAREMPELLDVLDANTKEMGHDEPDSELFPESPLQLKGQSGTGA